MRLAVVGKGGSGKSVVSATIARTLARRGRQVLALDSDSLPGMSFSLGAGASLERSPLEDAVERDEQRRWQWVAGVDPMSAARRYAITAPDGVRLLAVAKTTKAGLGPIDGAVNAFVAIINHLDDAPEFAGWAIVGDMPAGARQAAFGWAPYAAHFLLVVEPTWQSLLTARRIRRVAEGARPGARFSLAVNKVASREDATRAATFLELPALAAVPADDGIRRAERAGVAPLDHAPGSPAVAAIARLAERLDEDEAARAP
jgi:CO dehydrogenase maturation factor